MECVTCMCLARGGVGGEGGEWMRELGLGFSNPVSAYTRWNCLATTDASKSRSTLILTVRCSFQRVFCLGSVRSG